MRNFFIKFFTTLILIFVLVGFNNVENNNDNKLDDEVIDATNEISLTTRMIAMVENNFSFYSNNCEVLFSNIKFYE